ncbi:hypothetical protein PR202_ga03287 [Eleusine coracana subsp. coracana]|uniref:Uncharacterized protein n=1 Tax=Eleusine coracana subsp. coracana TaxID=191504 RepID=A0AAV5BLY3_ELECO|nr:hypothetical protein PR202_ga03287 [Eleusine coracana subsp. coracana]
MEDEFIQRRERKSGCGCRARPINAASRALPRPHLRPPNSAHQLSSPPFPFRVRHCHPRTYLKLPLHCSAAAIVCCLVSLSTLQCLPVRAAWLLQPPPPNNLVPSRWDPPFLPPPVSCPWRRRPSPQGPELVVQAAYSTGWEARRPLDLPAARLRPPAAAPAG